MQGGAGGGGFNDGNSAHLLSSNGNQNISVGFQR